MILLTTSGTEGFCEAFARTGLKLSLAESCTGGMIGSMITSVSGASSFFLGSAVTYSNESKERILGVSHDSLVKYGAVSEAVAKEMAEGSLKVYDSDIAASVTGIAGPNGGTPEKPVGTVWICVATTTRFNAQLHQFDPNLTRLEIIHKAAEAALQMLKEELLKDLGE